MDHNIDHTRSSRARRAAGSRTLGLRLVAVGLAVGAAGLVWPGHGADVAEAASAKVTICHRTHSTTNPYRRITVSNSAVQPGRHGGHDLPNGSSNPDVYDETFTYAPNNKYWGDVIPGATNGGSAYNGSNSIALNWTVAGQAIFFGSKCQAMSAKAFYDVEIAAGVPAADVVADLNDMQANEDKALLAELGGTFTEASVGTWESAISVTTDPASSVTSTSAVLNGTLDVGVNTAVSGFEWSTDPNLATYTSVAAYPTSVTGSGAVSEPLTGLQPNTTYYYRVTGTTDAGLDTEGILRGQIVSFTTPAATTTTSTTSTTTTTTSTTTTTTTTTTTEPPTSSSSTTVAPSSTSTTSTTAAPSTSSTTSTTVAPEPSTSTTSTTVVVPTTAAPGPVSEISGILWFDTDRDNTQDPGEAVLPDAPVELHQAGSPTALRSTRSGANGRYSFSGVAYGSYAVVASVPAQGIDPSFDTDGQTDWTVTVSVASLSPGVADFAGVGGGSLNGRLVDETGAVVRTTGEVVCTWAGADGVLGTGDDARFTTTAAADGTFDVGGVPYGSFSCGAVTTAGLSSSAVSAAVTSPTPTQVALPLPDATPTRRLPTAGADNTLVLALAAAFLVLGLGLVAGARRRA